MPSLPSPFWPLSMASREWSAEWHFSLQQVCSPPGYPRAFACEMQESCFNFMPELAASHASRRSEGQAYGALAKEEVS